MCDTSFLLSITGQIEWINIFTSTGSSWYCKYEFHTGSDWKIVGGLEAGLSQTSIAIKNNSKIVLNFPIDIVYKSSNPYGWPQIVISVYNGIQLKGYGRIHIPIQPGLHELYISLAKPQPSSLLGYLGTFFGYQPELLESKILASSVGNNLVRMVSTGAVKCYINIVALNLQSLGYDVGTSN